MKVFLVMAYGFAWGYVVHAKEIDKKLAAIMRDAWEDFARHNIRIGLEEASKIDARRIPPSGRGKDIAAG